jgi:hypothetical protein
MALPAALLTTTCDVYRPFGAASPTLTNVPCHLAAVFGEGQPRSANALWWTHYLLVDAGVDVRDGCARSAGADAVTYADGDQVVVPAGADHTSYVVVWVEVVARGQAGEYKRVYLLRHQAHWPGP